MPKVGPGQNFSALEISLQRTLSILCTWCFSCFGLCLHTLGRFLGGRLMRLLFQRAASFVLIRSSAGDGPPKEIGRWDKHKKEHPTSRNWRQVPLGLVAVDPSVAADSFDPNSSGLCSFQNDGACFCALVLIMIFAQLRLCGLLI